MNKYNYIPPAGLFSKKLIKQANSIGLLSKPVQTSTTATTATQQQHNSNNMIIIGLQFAMLCACINILKNSSNNQSALHM